MIEHIFAIDKSTGKTLKDLSFEEIKIIPGPLIVVQDPKYLNNLRSNLSMPKPSFKNKFELRTEIINKIKDHQLFENYPAFFHLFFKDKVSLYDLIKEDSHFLFENFENQLNDLEFYEEKISTDFNEDANNFESYNLLPEPQNYYSFINKQSFENHHVISCNQLNIEYNLENNLSFSIDLKIEPIKQFLVRNNISSSNSKNFIEDIKNFLLAKEKEHFNVVICYSNDVEEKFLKEFLISGTKFSYLKTNHPEGFIDHHEKNIFLAYSDIKKVKRQKAKKVSKKNIDLFAEQITTLKEGDYVIHKRHGIGKYNGLIQMNFGGSESDFLEIEYKGSDKVYVPVYKMDLVQKHADADSEATVANLKSKKFDLLRTKAKQSVKKLAFDLLELQAQRKLQKGFAFSPPDEEYIKFEDEFPFSETPDQASAIHDVIEDMTNIQPMDRLICGDVGFGKTEVAMRAAFKAVQDGKQVAVLVPTTILAFQHFNNFAARFKNFPINVELVSRFRTAKEVRDVIEKTKLGVVDILVGTHKLLSKNIEYKDLGLVVVDEEHRFGVGHKEKLKVLKSNIDFLTMTATPIPRTLQLSFLGIKNLSLIQTPPPSRQSIKTYVIKNDDSTIKQAIDKELSRGGQVFIVHNRVFDIDSFAHHISELSPKAKVCVAHGQMSEKELEKKITDFYQHKYDILIATTIIESGIDIPNANTMIIDKANTFGLAQLHQLRGRIGRSDKKAYAYFMIPKNKGLSELASRRLKALQLYADVGSGFSLASSDLEIRGAGDILGPEQSGHITSVGLELYMELLQEAIADLKGQTQAFSNSNLEISSPYICKIPADYIDDSKLRLKYYKRLSNSKQNEGLNFITEEIEDIFGPLPEQLNNLKQLLTIRNSLSHLPLKNVKIGTNTITYRFNQDIISEDKVLQEKIVSTFIKMPRKFNMKPDYSITYRHNGPIEPEKLEKITGDFALHLDPN